VLKHFSTALALRAEQADGRSATAGASRDCRGHTLAKLK